MLTLEEQHVMKCYTGARTWADSVERPPEWKVNMGLGTYSIRILSVGQAERVNHLLVRFSDGTRDSVING